MFLPTVVMLLYLACMTFVPIRDARACEALCDPHVGSSPPKPPQSPGETKQKAFGYVHCVRILKCKTEQPGYHGQTDPQLPGCCSLIQEHLRSMNQTLKASFVDGETLTICPKSSGSQAAVSQFGHGALFFLYKILMLEHTD